MNSEKEYKIILFDGVCNLCNSSVNFVIRHDKKNLFKFAALQPGNNFIPVLVSGGVGTINDVVAVQVQRNSNPRIEGLVIGKAIYTGRMHHDQLVRLTDFN